MKSLNMKIYAFIFLVIMSVTVKADLALLKQGVKLYRDADYSQAAFTFYKMANLKNLDADLRHQANYYLGLSLYKLKMYQASGEPMRLVVKSGSKKYRQKALEKLVAISNKSGNQGMLDFALSEMQASDLDKLALDIYYYKMASLSYDRNNIDQAIQYLNQAVAKNPKSEASLNLLALSYLKKNKTQEAIDAYQKLLSTYESKASSNEKKNYTALNLARAYYQAKSFDKARDYYLQIPKKSEAYRESLLELGWTYLQLDQQQKAIAALQNLHTPYYENFYDPESLFLRAILHNHNCQFDEALKVIDTFKKNYDYVFDTLRSWQLQPVSSRETFTEIDYAAETLKHQGGQYKLYLSSIKNYNGKIPFKVTRSILRNNIMKSLYDEHQLLLGELELAKSHFGADKAEMRPFFDNIYTERAEFLKKQLVTLYNQLLKNTEKSMTYYKQQLSLVSYEIIDAQKIQLREKTLSKVVNEELNKDINEAKDRSRRFYEKKGAQYWPYQGEFWKDEIGGFEYFGENRCVQE